MTTATRDLDRRARRERAAEILTPESARVRRPAAARARPAAARAARRARRAVAAARAGELPDFLPETRDGPRRRLARARGARRPARPPRRDHRPGRPQDGDQRAQLGRERLHGRLRGRELADLGERRRRAGQPRRRRRAHDLARAGREELRAATSETATLVVRPRGWHLVEKHALLDGAPVSASLFDFGLYVFHCAPHARSTRGSGPYFYLPKLESHREARAVARRVHARRGAARARAAARFARPS